MEFYSVQLRKKVEVPDKDLTKVMYKRTTSGGKEQVRYAVKADYKDNGKNIALTKFVNKETYDSLKVPEKVDSGDKTKSGGAKASGGTGDAASAESSNGGAAKTTRSRSTKTK